MSVQRVIDSSSNRLAEALRVMEDVARYALDREDLVTALKGMRHEIRTLGERWPDGWSTAHRDVPELMPYLHLPVQSGSDRVLQAMNRRHGRDFYLDLVDRLRAARPDLGLSSDFIVGFPGESDADFEETLDLVRAVGYVQAYSFKYSPRPGTPAAAMEMQVPEDVKDARLAALQDLLNEQQRAFNESCVGRTLPVLLDRPGRHEGQLVGRSPYMQAVHVEAPSDWMGRIVDLDIVSAGGNSLGGVPRGGGNGEDAGQPARLTA